MPGAERPSDAAEVPRAVEVQAVYDALVEGDEGEETAVIFVATTEGGYGLNRARSVASLDLVLIDSGDGLEVSGPASASALAVLGLEGPSV